MMQFKRYGQRKKRRAKARKLQGTNLGLLLLAELKDLAAADAAKGDHTYIWLSTLQETKGRWQKDVTEIMHYKIGINIQNAG